MRGRIAFLTLVSFSIAAAPALAQFDDGFDKGFNPPATRSKLPEKFLKLADVNVEMVPARARWGETVTLKLTIALKPGAGGHTYPLFPNKYPGQTSKNFVKLPGPDDPAADGLIFLDDISDPTTPALAEKQRDEAPPGVKDEYYATAVTWEFKAVVSPRATPGKKKIGLGKNTRLQVCTDECIPAFGDKLPTASFEVLEGASDRVVPKDLDAALRILLGKKSEPPAPAVVRPAPTSQPDATLAPVTAVQTASAASDEHARKLAKPIDVYTSDLASVRSTLRKSEAPSGTSGSIWGFVLTAAAWGLISLVTPCVFPMIPITVSIFLKHAHGSLKERLKLAGVYCLTIISVLGVSAFALLKFMAMLSTNPVTNILLGVLFLVLALSLFGMYELALPGYLGRRLQAKQAKGGVIGTVFGALAFTVISFTCVAPFLGGFAGISSADAAGGSLIAVPTVKEIAGGLAFATAFAAPFFVLALIPGLLKALPRSGGWLDNVKVVMGFLELAAALKFLRTAEVGILPASEYFTYDLVLGGWVAISVACGLYLLNLYRLPHDEESSSIGVPRLLFALLFLGLGCYLAPALFKSGDGRPQRPAGAVYAWVEAFLLPETTSEWGTDLKSGIEQARKSGKPVFLDFTGVTCTNCKYNEGTIFSRPDVRVLLDKFQGVQLYTDWVPERAYATDPGESSRHAEGKANRDFQEAAFGDIALPLYTVLVPEADGSVRVLGTRSGKINDPASFAAWLKESLEQGKK